MHSIKKQTNKQKIVSNIQILLTIMTERKKKLLQHARKKSKN